jgi:hypothetical protein
MGRRGTVSSRTTRYRGEPQRHGAFGEVAAGGREAGGGDGADVTLGLQEPGDDLGFAGADEGGGFLEADGGAEPGGQDVVVAVPPAGCAGLAGQGEERVDLAAVGDAVGHQQALDGQGLEAALGAFHPADGPFGGADGIPGLLVAHPGFLAQGLELAGQDHAQHGGAAAVGAGHRFLPLSLFQASGCHRFRSRAICALASCRQVSVPVLPFPHRPAPGTGHSKHTIVPAERGGAGRQRGGVTVLTGGRRGPGWRVMDADPRQAGQIRDWIRPVARQGAGRLLPVARGRPDRCPRRRRSRRARVVWCDLGQPLRAPASDARAWLQRVLPACPLAASTRPVAATVQLQPDPAVGRHFPGAVDHRLPGGRAAVRDPVRQVRSQGVHRGRRAADGRSSSRT